MAIERLCMKKRKKEEKDDCSDSLKRKENELRKLEEEINDKLEEDWAKEIKEVIKRHVDNNPDILSLKNIWKEFKVLRESIFISSVLYGVEVMCNLTVKDIKELVAKDEHL